MANIGVRSPYFITLTATDATYGTLTVSVGGDLKYTLNKDVTPGTNTVTVDISQLVRDYINPTYNNPSQVAISTTLTLYDIDDVELSSDTQSHVAFDAYYYYSEGNNCVVSDGDLVSGSDIWVPEGASGFIYSLSGASLSKVTFSSAASSVSSTTINRFPCSRYDAVSLTFLNKYGVLQQLWFSAKTISSQSVSKGKYKSKYNANDGSNDPNKHQVVEYNKNGKKQYTLNTQYVPEFETSFNDQMQELLLSEYVWLDGNGIGSAVPVTVSTSNITYKNSLNDRLVNYQVQVEQAFDLISTAR